MTRDKELHVAQAEIRRLTELLDLYKTFLSVHTVNGKTELYFNPMDDEAGQILVNKIREME